MKYERKKDYSETLPIAKTLDRYDVSEWLVFGMLTHANPTKAETQLERFKILMDTIGGVNRCHGKRLHWFVRFEGDEQHHNHLHFILGKHKVANGHSVAFTAQDACEFLNRNWGKVDANGQFQKYGITKLKPYDEKRDGVGYVCKAWQMVMRDDPYLMSHALKMLLMPEVNNEKK